MHTTPNELEPSQTSYRFGSVLMTTFSCLSIPILAVVLLITYTQNSRAIRQQLQEEVEMGREKTTENVGAFFRQSVETIQGLTEIAAANPDYFRKNESISVIKSALSSVDHVDSIRVTFEDAFSRGATRVDDLRRAQQVGIPKDAQWQTYTIEPTDDTNIWQYHRAFYAHWPTPTKLQGESSSEDPRTVPQYSGAKKTSAAFIAEPSLNTASGEVVIPIASPIILAGNFIGAVQANLTIVELSHFLYLNRLTPNTISAIIDDKGDVLVPPVSLSTYKDKAFSMNLFMEQTRIKEKIEQALNSNPNNSTLQKTFSANIDGSTNAISIFEIPNPFGVRWKVLTITPDGDLIGSLEDTNVTILWLLAVLVPLQLILIHRISARASRGLQNISEQVNDIRELNFQDRHHAPGLFKVKELVDIRHGVALLQNTLQSLAQYIPIGVVRDLVESGRPLSLGVESRELTIMFCDLENFSSMAQKFSADSVLDHLTAFFSCATDAIGQERGTVDKFIGDEVMAFWGAPNALADHQLRACAAALRITRRMEKLNALWKTEGKETLHVRTGLHCSEVLVGNIGSNERISYTAIGDGVNIAARLEGVNKQFGTSICLSDSVYSHVADHVVARPLQMVSVKGRLGEFMVYELLGIKGSSDPELMVQGE
jgi:class 3 adenylate cyclase